MKRLGGGDGGLPPGIIKRPRIDPSTDKNPVIELHPGGIYVDVWKEILSVIYQPGNSSHLARVCKKWKQIHNALHSEWPQAIRIQTLSSLFKRVKKENLSHEKNALIEDYINDKSLSFCSAHIFKKKWLKEDFDSTGEYDVNKSVEAAIRNIEELTGIGNLRKIIHTDYASIENAMTGLEHISDESTPISMLKKLIIYLLESRKYEMAFALTEVIFITYTLDFRKTMIEFLIERFGFEQTIRLIFALECQEFFLHPLIADGCVDLNVRKQGNIDDLFKLKTQPFLKAIFKCFNENKIKCALPLNTINFLIRNLIYPLHRMRVHSASAVALKEKLLDKAFEIIPCTHDFECQKGLISSYCHNFVEHNFIPSPRYGPESWEGKELFEKALKNIAHPGLTKSVLASLLDDFYRFCPNMRDWWKTMREIEKVFYPKFDAVKQFPSETRATEELVYYLITNHMFIEELKIPSKKLTNFSFALTMLLQQNPSLLNEFLFPRLKEELSIDSISLSDESSLEIFQDNTYPYKDAGSTLDDPYGEFSEDATEEEFKISQREVFNIYTCVIDLLLKHQRDKVAESVISHIEPESLRKELEDHFQKSK